MNTFDPLTLMSEEDLLRISGFSETQIKEMLGTIPVNRKSKPASIREVQHEGTHYKDEGIEPVEYWFANKLDAFQGEVVKLITRFRKKGKAGCLKKAIHYIQMLVEFEYGIESTITYNEKTEFKEYEKADFSHQDAMDRAEKVNMNQETFEKQAQASSQRIREMQEDAPTTSLEIRHHNNECYIVHRILTTSGNSITDIGMFRIRNKKWCFLPEDDEAFLPRELVQIGQWGFSLDANNTPE